MSVLTDTTLTQTILVYLARLVVVFVDHPLTVPLALPYLLLTMMDLALAPTRLTSLFLLRVSVIVLPVDLTAFSALMLTLAPLAKVPMLRLLATHVSALTDSLLMAREIACHAQMDVKSVLLLLNVPVALLPFYFKVMSVKLLATMDSLRLDQFVKVVQKDA